MNVLIFLFLILCIMSFIILGKSSFYLLIGLFMSFGIFLGFSLSLRFGVPLTPSLLISLFTLSGVILFFVNGYTTKTKSAFLCVIITFTLIILIIPTITKNLNIAGFSSEEIEEISALNLTAKMPFEEIVSAVVIFSMSGAIIDASIAITSSMYELHNQIKFENRHKLIASGMKVATELLSSSIHTLFFAFIANNLALFFWFYDLNYPLSTVINSKVFITELTISLLAGASTVITLPLTACFSGYYFMRTKK